MRKKSRMEIDEEIKVLENPSTTTLFDLVDQIQKTSKQMEEYLIISPQFFHLSHSKRDREIICEKLEDFYKCKIKRRGLDGVSITFKK